MLRWISDGNKHEEVWNTYFGSCEITIIQFKATGTYLAYARKMPSAPAMCKSSYPATFTIEEVQKDIVDRLEFFLTERVQYYTEMLSSLFEERDFKEEDEYVEN